MVGLFGPTDPALSGPYGHQDDTIRSPEAANEGAHYRDSSLSDRLMRFITLEEVLEMAQHRLGLSVEAQR